MEETSATQAVIDTMQASVSTDITAVGIAMITLAGIAVGFKWVKAAFFG